VWRLDRKTDDDDRTSDIGEDDALNPRTTTAPHTLSLGDPALVAGNIAEPVWKRFRDELLPGIRLANQAALDKIAQRYALSFDVDVLPAPFAKPVLILTGHQDSDVGYRDQWKLLQDYPTADITPEAQFYLGEAYRAQGNAAAADTAYAMVIQKFPKSPHAPTALYKRALYLEQQGNATAARALLNQLISTYPQSDEAALARDHLRELK